MSEYQLGRRDFVGAIAALGAAGAVLGASSLASPAALTPVPFPGLDHERFMRAAIDQARKVPQLPFGAVIVRGATGESVAAGWNRTRENPTFHAEMDAINRCAAAARGSDWSELVLYSTAEPCPMCQSAIEWAGIAMAVYGTAIPFLLERGWWQIDLRAAEVARRARFRRTALLGGILEQECNALFLSARRRV